MPERRAQSVLQKDIDTHAFYRGMGVFAVVLIALALSWGATQGSTVIEPARADAGQYIWYAWNLKHHGVYSHSDSALTEGIIPAPDALRTPGYPFFLLPFLGRELTPAFIQPVQTIQSLLVGATVLVAFFLFRTFMPYIPALAGTFLTAISPHLANSAIYVLTESLFAFIVALSLLLLSKLLKRPGMALAVVAGLALGYGALVRPSLQYLPLVVVPILWMHLNRPERLKVAGVLVAAYLAVWGGWGARNLYSVDQWSDPTQAAATVQHGMYPDMMYEGEPESLGVAYKFDPATERIAGDMGAILEELWERAGNNPGKYLGWYMIGKPLVFWQWDIIAGMGDVFVYPTTDSPYRVLWPFQVSHAISSWLHWPLVAFGLIGCVLALVPYRGGDNKRQAGAARFVSATLFYFTLLHMVGAPYPRYSIPLRPELFGMAVFACWVVWERCLSGLPILSGHRRDKPTMVER